MLGQVLKAVMRLKDAESFLLPVPGNFPGYHKVVKQVILSGWLYPLATCKPTTLGAYYPLPFPRQRL